MLVNRDIVNLDPIYFPVSSTIAGVVCKDGVILATEKIVINKMMISGTDKRVYSVTKNIGSVSYALLFDMHMYNRS